MTDLDRPATADDAPPTHAISRRDLLAGAAGAVGGVLLAGIPTAAGGQQGTNAAAQAAAVAPPPLAPIPDDPTKVLGTPTTPVGSRSRFVTAARNPVGELLGVSYTPLQDLTGTITPSDLHFERHHGGVPIAAQESVDRARDSQGEPPRSSKPKALRGCVRPLVCRRRCRLGDQIFGRTEFGLQRGEPHGTRRNRRARPGRRAAHCLGGHLRGFARRDDRPAE